MQVSELIEKKLSLEKELNSLLKTTQKNVSDLLNCFCSETGVNIDRLDLNRGFFTKVVTDADEITTKVTLC